MKVKSCTNIFILYNLNSKKENILAFSIHNQGFCIQKKISKENNKVKRHNNY
jgi:hypothetical protein